MSTLLKLQQNDIDTRNKLLEDGRLYKAYEQDMQAVLRQNAEALNGLIGVYSWPGISKVGQQGCRAACLIAQHAICTPDLQRGFLVELKKAVESGDVPKQQVAMLSDRIRFNEGRPQLYGTVLDWNVQGELDCELEDPDTVDERRQKFGLPAYQKALLEQRKQVQAEGGKAPVDFVAYKQQQSKWAKETGWMEIVP